MRISIGKKVVEDIISICDNCKQTSDFGFDASVKFRFGYGSKHDMDAGETIFCSKCAEELRALLERHYPNVKFIQRHDAL